MNRDLRSIMVVAPNWLGDAVMSLPLIGFLSAVTSVRLRVVAPPYTVRVFQGLSEIDELIVLARNGFTRRIFERARTISRLDSDAVIVLPPSFSEALMLFLSGTRRRVGFAGDARRALLSSALPAAGLRDEHLSKNFLRLGREVLADLGLTEPALRGAPALKVFDADRERVAAALSVRGIEGGEYAVVVPGATYGPTKHWPMERYRALIERLRANVAVVVAGGPQERQLSAQIVSGLDNVADMTGETTLGEFFALLGGASVVVANDSGAPHVAASLGAPVVVVFGSTSPTWTSPLGRDVRIVREPVHCAPCFRRECPTNLECFEGITTERVYDRTVEAIQGRSLETAG
jgi:heptosyltransferase-2